MEWLRRALVCNGAVVAGPLDPTRLSDADLPDICLRMHAILATIEMPRCEGRLIPRDLFDAIDTLESLVFGHRSPAGHSSPPRLAEWLSVIREFGDHYGLCGRRDSIAVDPAVFREVAARYAKVPKAEPPAALGGECE